MHKHWKLLFLMFKKKHFEVKLIRMYFSDLLTIIFLFFWTSTNIFPTLVKKKNSDWGEFLL